MSKIKDHKPTKEENLQRWSAIIAKAVAATRRVKANGGCSDRDAKALARFTANILITLPEWLRDMLTLAESGEALKVRDGLKSSLKTMEALKLPKRKHKEPPQ